MSVRLAKVWSETSDYAVGEWGNALLTAWRAPVTAEALEVTRVASHDLHSRHPDGIVVFNVIPHMVPLPSNPVRKKASAVLHETGSHVLCTVTIIGGTGLWVSAARAAVATITLFSRSPHPHKVFGKITEGAAFAGPWIAEDASGPKELADAAEQIAARGA